MVKHKLLIIEEHAILRMGLIALLRTEPDFDVIADYGTLSQALPDVAGLAPDLVITDFDVNELTNGNPVAALKEQCPTTRVLILTHHTHEASIRATLRAGAGGYLLKNVSSTELVTAVRSLLAGKPYLSPSISDKVINAFLVKDKVVGAQKPLHTLTNREREILQWVAEGCTSRHIAERLNLSIKTVDKHRSNLMRKLDLHNASALTTFAIGHGLINAQE